VLAQSYEIRVDNESLDKVLDRLSETYQLKLSYDPSSVAAYSINGIFTGEQPEDLLDQVLEKLPFRSKRARSVLLIVPSKRRKQNQFSGRVIDQSTGQPLAYAYIQVGNDQTAISDQQGRFKFPSNADSTLLSIRYVGYENEDIWISKSSDKLDISLEQDPTKAQQLATFPSIHSRSIVCQPWESRTYLSQFSCYRVLGLLMNPPLVSW
jgi:hypothetical protein